jgi:hypothetical protein
MSSMCSGRLAHHSEKAVAEFSEEDPFGEPPNNSVARTSELPLSVPSPATQSKWILIAGPYRSGTGDNPDLLDKNVKCMEAFALPIFRAGHVPVLGEWLAIPLVQLAGSKRIGDEAFNEIFHPIAIRLLDKCDGVLRVGGPSAGADEMVRIARERRLDVYSSLQEIPGCSASPLP